MGEFIAFLILLAIGGILHFIMGPTPGAQLIDTNKGEVIPVEELLDFAIFEDGVVHAVLIRQSGNIYRDLGAFVSAEAALAEIVKSFRRAKIDEVRVTHADKNSVAVYRRVYNFIGRAEGKKLAGARIVRAGEDREQWLTA
ncbi:hypothetical protein [Aquicoccus porphyridii]|uniref:hypothetical protein n=1 Tax=Aquicoccus porphyridii TaxID=1852029 RepID=UPI00273DE259|nr:hypothetical protein [Aquicoccus porphyridii]